MSDLENDLKKALGRQSPPEGFSEKVLAKLPRRDARPPLWTRLANLVQPPTRWAIATAALIVLLVAGTWQLWRSGSPSDPTVVREQTASREGEQAKAQLMLALRITSAELREVQKRVAEAGTSLSDNGEPARGGDHGNGR